MYRRLLIQKIQQLIDKLPISKKRKEVKQDLLNLKLSSDDKFFISLANKYKNIRGTQPHYENGKDYDIIDVIRDYELNFCRGNIIKYIARAGKKHDELLDLIKAQDYLNREIELLRSKNKIDRWTN